jgi:uncharacterized membrane protein YhiD involved in acid resistance
MMGANGMMNGAGMWGAGLFGILILLLVILAIAALIKYLRD